MSSRARFRGLIGVFLAIGIIVGCQFLPAGDPGVHADVWNKTDSTLDIVIEPVAAGRCHRLPPGTLANVYSETGFSTPLIRFYSEQGELVRTLRQSEASVLFIVAALDDIEEVPIEYKVGPVYDMPAFPEIDGEPIAPSLPQRHDICPLR